MRGFEDKNGKMWTLELNVGSAKRVRAECGIDLINAMAVAPDGEVEISVLERIAEDPCLLVSVIFSLCRTQAENANLDDASFAELFNGDTVEHATDALIEEIINFSPSVKRKALMKIYQTTQRFTEKMRENLDEMLDDQKLNAEIESQLMKLSGGAPGSSE